MAEKKKKTPEEEALAKQRMAEGQAYIQQREKLASQQGTTSHRAGEQLIPQEQAKLEGKMNEAEIMKIQQEMAKNVLPTTEKVPSGMTDEFGNPTFLNKPIEQPNAEDLLKKEANPFEVGGAIGAGVAAAGGGAGLGAAIGSAFPGVGNVVGAAVGGVIGFAGGFLGKVAIDEHQNVKELKTNYMTSVDNINKIKAAASNPAYRNQALVDWTREKNNIMQIEAILKRKTDDNLKDFLGDAGDEYVDVVGYMRTLPLLEQEFLLNRAMAGKTIPQQ